MSVWWSGYLHAQQEKEKEKSTTKRYSAAVIEQAEGYLSDAGLRRSGKSIIPDAQATQIRNLTTISRKVSDVKKASGALATLQEESKNLDLAEASANRNLRDVNVRRAAGGLTVNEMQRLTAMNNALISQMNEFHNQRKDLKEKTTTARSEVQTLESGFVDEVIKARETLDTARAEVASHLQEKNVKIAFKVLASEYGTPENPEIGTIFKTLEFKIHELEKMFLKESVALIDDGGRTKKIAVSINGAAPVEMILDSGADIVLIPKSTAEKLNLVVNDAMPQILLSVADGRSIPGRVVMLDKVRVGKFEVTQVEAAVLESEAGALEPLLGMSFLGNFQFQLDAAKNELWLTQVKSNEESKAKR
jgi:aspartyl protease family protein